jgi:cytochrome c oxidase subunit 2
MDHIPDIFGQLPRAASTLAPGVDRLFLAAFWLGLLVFVFVTGAMLSLLVKSRGKVAVAPAAPEGKHLARELAWTFAPALVLLALLHFGFKEYVFGAVAPAVGPGQALEFRVRARQWAWQFEYPAGTREDGLLVVPVNQPIKLVFSSDDSLHSFFVPAFRLKRDVVPGMFSTAWFEATSVGDYRVLSPEYAGAAHPEMAAKIRVVTPERYQEFLIQMDRPPPGKTKAQWGADLFAANGCTSCHRVEAGDTTGIGPNLFGVIGTQQPLEGGATALADLAYVTESVTRPQAKIVRGFTSVPMTTFTLAPSRIEAIYAYLETLH